jgi:excisionase family DNA binding protein
MAKMFYTTEEAAEQLGVDQSRIEEMVANGELQQFRDRDKVMFKRDQVDALAGGGQGEGQQQAQPAEPSGDTGQHDARSASGTAIPLEDSDHNQPAQGQAQQGSGGSQSGVNVFSPSEVGGQADPGDQTQVTSGATGAGSESEEMSIESVGSGSGLLDLTRESDDTSLGAELMDEIYPSEGQQQGSGGSQAGATGIADALSDTGGGEAGGAGGTGTGSGIAQAAGGSAAGAAAQPAQPAAQAGPAPAPAAETTREPAAVEDPAGEGLGTGFMLGAALALILGLLAVIAGVVGAESGIAASMTASSQSFFLWIGGLVVISVLFGLLGLAIGNASAKPGRR